MKLFNEGLAAVKIGKQWGFVDVTGKLVIPVQFDDVSSFAEGLAAARKGKVWSYIDSAGAEVISGKYKEAAPFSEGLARTLVDYQVEFMFGNHLHDIVFCIGLFIRPVNRCGIYSVCIQESCGSGSCIDLISFFCQHTACFQQIYFGFGGT